MPNQTRGTLNSPILMPLLLLPHNQKKEPPSIRKMSDVRRVMYYDCSQGPHKIIYTSTYVSPYHHMTMVKLAIIPIASSIFIDEV